MRPCVFLDRDGIVNRSPGAGYVERWEDFEFDPAFFGILRRIREYGYEAVVVTNQKGIARGIMTQEAVETIHRNMCRVLSEHYGLALLDVYFCPHGDNKCDCRKPAPGMLLRAAREHDLDLARSWMVGDGERDVVAGRAAGCRTVLVSPREESTIADFRVADLEELESLIARHFRLR